ncbi:MAG: GrpB family protein [Bacillus sp. (in: firmicutes)]
MKRKVEVVPFQSSWASAFQQEADWLKAIWREDLLAVHHIGSTSIKGMCAKPIIDIMLVVKDINRADSFNEEMMGIGYEPMGENGIEGRRFFRKGGNERTHHVHVFEEGNQEIERHLLFLDYLREHPQEARAYAELKGRLAADHPKDIDSYIEGKDAFIKAVDEAASRWKRT